MYAYGIVKTCRPSHFGGDLYVCFKDACCFLPLVLPLKTEPQAVCSAEHAVHLNAYVWAYICVRSIYAAQTSMILRELGTRHRAWVSLPLWIYGDVASGYDRERQLQSNVNFVECVDRNTKHAQRIKRIDSTYRRAFSCRTGSLGTHLRTLRSAQLMRSAP